MDTDSRIAELYDRFLENGYAQLAADPASYPLFPVMERVCRDYPPASRGGTVLDVACGPGLLLEAADYTYYAGIDLSEAMLQAAANRGYSELIQSSLLDYLPLIEDGSYDSVICFSAAYFLDPQGARELAGHMRRIARKFWLLTLDAVPADLAAMYAEQGVPLYDHSGMELPALERFTVEGWQSAVDGSPVPMEIALGFTS